MTAVADQPQSVAPVRRGRRTFAIAVALALVLMIILGVLALLLITPGGPQGDASAVSATFLGYTNNAVGTRVAIFNINNRSPLAIRRQWYYEVQVLTNGTWKPEPTVRLPYARGPVIPPNESEVWTIDVPARGGQWRVVFPYVEHQTQFEEMKEVIRKKLGALGFRQRKPRPGYAGFSNEVAPDEAVESR
jgi:hypothetical protein